MLSVAAGAGFLMVYSPLPDPSVATRQQLFQWLVLRDLSQESAETRQSFSSVWIRSSRRLAIWTRRARTWRTRTARCSGTMSRCSWSPGCLAKCSSIRNCPLPKDCLHRSLPRSRTLDQVGVACLKKSSGPEPKRVSSVSKLVMEQIERCGNRGTAPEERHVNYAKANGVRFVEELKSLLRIPSISTDPDRAGDVRRAGELCGRELRRIGMENVRLIETSTAERVLAPSSGPAQVVPGRKGHPLVYADHIHAEPVSGRPATTVLFYGTTTSSRRAAGRVAFAAF